MNFFVRYGRIWFVCLGKSRGNLSRGNIACDPLRFTGVCLINMLRKLCALENDCLEGELIDKANRENGVVCVEGRSECFQMMEGIR